MRYTAILIAVLFALAAPSARAQPADAAPVIAAERAFAADGLTLGIDASFLKWSTDDAVMISRGAARRAHDVLNPDAVFDPAKPSLAWWPTWAGISKSGDLGFTSGAVVVGGQRTGQYFTVWQRQADGGWKWVYDGGTEASAAESTGPEIEPVLLPTSVLGSPSPDAAMAEVRSVEAVLSASALLDQKAAHLSLLAPDGRLLVAPLPPAIGPAAFSDALDVWPARMTLSTPFGGGASEAGDLVWTYGRAEWSVETASRAGHYVHVWQKRATGWVLIFAQLLADPMPRTVAASPSP